MNQLVVRITRAPVLVFCSYSHHDHEFRLELETQLSPLVRQKLITFWSDRRIAPGDAWERAIDQKLEEAEIVLLLISAYFVQSDYCYTTELQRALERDRLNEARVVPVFVRPCEWEGLDFARLQGLPADAKPIGPRPDREEAWTEVVRGIRRIALELQGKHRDQPAAALPPSESTTYDSSAYLRSLVGWYRAAFTGHPRIRIHAKVNDTDTIVSLEHALTDWSSSPGPRLAVLIGDPGSGKTYALRSLAAFLASQYTNAGTQVAPIVVAANKLGQSEAFRALRDAIPEATSLLQAIEGGRPGVILIDGWDEVASAESASVLDLVVRLAGATSDKVRIAVASRPPFKEQLVAALSAISIPLSLEIQPLSDAQMRETLEHSPLASRAIERNLREPFALKLFSQQSEADAQLTTGFLDLYERALTSIIERELERSRMPPSIQASAVWDLLVAAAAAMSGIGSIPLGHIATNRLTEPERAAIVNSLITAGVLALDAHDRLTFAHASLLDFFFALAVERELSSWNAARLARANLIYDYNVNRFLVPALLRRMPRDLDAEARMVRQQLALSPATAGGRFASPPITRGQFRQFMDSTGWRRATGFGYWGTVEARDGTGATVGKVLFDGTTVTGLSVRSDRDPVSGISWYDAQQFAWWIGGQLPPASACEPNPAVLQWTSDWQEETKAIIRLVGKTLDSISGANPDVRSAEIGFAVLLPSA